MMSLLRAPVRLGIVVTFALAVLAGFAVTRLAHSAVAGCRRRWSPPLAIELAAMPGRCDAPIRCPSAYRMLAQLPRRGRRVPVPYQSERLSQSHAVHVQFDLSLAAARERLQRSDRRRISMRIAAPINAVSG